ncbi:MAG: sensor histidine kinase [Egibacteraceae bacterium]
MRVDLGRLAGHRTTVVGDLSVASFLFAYTAIELIAGADAHEGVLALHLAGGALMTLPLALRRTVPWLPGVAFLPAMLLDTVLTVPASSFGEFMAAMLAVYSLAVHASPREALVGGTSVAVAIGVFLARDPMTESVLDALSTIVVLGVWAGIGLFVRRRRGEIEERARRAAMEERTRIARDLHDLVGHAVSLMTVQAGVARVAVDGNDTPRAREALGAVETAGRQALDELRRVLGMLQTPGGDGEAGLAPQPGIEAVEDLVEQHRRAGLPVDLHHDGQPRAVPAGVALAVYRIVQEALTNVRKHAGAPRTDVTLRYRPQAVEVAVHDQGPGHRGRPRDGQGLPGMRERVALYGGELRVGPGPRGGFALEAIVPTTEDRR